MLLVSACSTYRPELTQISTIDALLAGVYDGSSTCGELLQYGDFGIGTFNALDGEMIVIDGVVYKARADGKVLPMPPETFTPFATVCTFEPNMHFPVSSLNMDQLKMQLDSAIPNQNIFVAVRINGFFDMVKYRSIPAQMKPYPPLADAAKHQNIFQKKAITGSIVGFRCPPYTKGINVAGWHLHFISDDRQNGGHILALQLTEGEALCATAHDWLVRLPKGDAAFADTNLAEDRTAALHRVEQDSK